MQIVKERTSARAWLSHLVLTAKKHAVDNPQILHVRHAVPFDVSILARFLSMILLSE